MFEFDCNFDQLPDQQGLQSFSMSDEEFQRLIDDMVKDMDTAGHSTTLALAAPEVDSSTSNHASNAGTDYFWETAVSHTLIDGRVVSGTVRELFDGFPELRKEIEESYSTVNGAINASVQQPQPATRDLNTPVQPDTVAGYVWDPEVLDQKYSLSKEISPAGARNDAIRTPPPTVPKKRRIAPKIKQDFVLGQIPGYIADIRDADDARHQLANPDSSDYTSIFIGNDDVRTVKTRLHSYAARFYDAVYAEGIQEPTLRVDRIRESKVADKLKVRFQGQQREALVEITALMQSPQQLKNARCRCVLAVEAAIFVHEVGVPNELAERAHGKYMTTKERYTQVDRNLACSERLEKMIQMTQEYKLVAIDILTGKNLSAIAHNPTGYAENKLSYLMSNLLRQDRLEEIAAKEKAKGGERAKKPRKRVAKSVEDADSVVNKPETKKRR